ncbi:hybrid sensor histidine kinase/response regulator [Sphingomonas sp. MS122]|uniref:ATP-binding response regulator n=1 Tax=Sphingomonas sp. MS122 TaxID=3412683 RepID=UPI003C2FF97A
MIKAALHKLIAFAQHAVPGGSNDHMTELNRAKAAAEAANEAKSRFLASVSHEIRAPLNSIYGYAQLLERSNGSDAAKAAKVIRRSSEHLITLVEGLLDISQVESGTLRLSRDTIRFPALLEQIVEMFEPQASAKGLDFRFNCATGLPEFVRGDQKRLRQVLINLLSNAIKFTERGSVALTVRYRNELATLEVIDTGIGIRPRDIERIFDPFERGSDAAAHRQSGAGLGLSITQALVHIMGGDIGVESEPGGGSRFTVRVMLSQPLSQPTDAPPAGIVTGYAGSRRTILAIDDDPAQLNLLQSLLEPLGFDVLTARGGDEGIAIAGRVRPNLVLLDISMPGKSGWETADILRQHHGAALSLVMLSSDAHQPHPGGNDSTANSMLLMKPFEFNMLLDVISTQLGLEWTGPGTGDRSRAEARAGRWEPLSPRIRPYLAEIERLVRIGHIRGIEAQIEAIAALHPEATHVVEEMRRCLDSFDLKALAAIARASQTNAD